MPELLGRLPIKINLKALNRKDFQEILTRVEFSLLEQQKALINTEGIDITFTDCGIEEICKSNYPISLMIPRC